MKNIMNARSGGERRKRFKYKLNINYFSVFPLLLIFEEKKLNIKTCK